MDYTNQLFQFIEVTRNELNNFLSEIKHKNDILYYADVVRFIFTKINVEGTKEFEKIIYDYIIEDCFLKVHNTDKYDEFLSLLNIKDNFDKEELNDVEELQPIEVCN